jgi:hypothetical protein
MTYETIQNSHEIEDSKEIEKKIESFKTAKGSIYQVDEKGRTTRFKTATNEQDKQENLTVYVPISEGVEKDYLMALHTDIVDGYINVFVLQPKEDSQGYETVWDIDDVRDPSKVYLAIIKDGEMTRGNQASLKPEIGYNVYETSLINKGKRNIATRHLGSKVTEIHYAA